MKGIAPIHERGEYHGDIHDDNVMIRRRGIGFEVKLLDFFDLGKPTKSKIYKDVLNLVQVFHTLVGGQDTIQRAAEGREEYHSGAEGFIDSCAISERGDIQRHLENLDWSEWSRLSQSPNCGSYLGRIPK